MKSISPDNSNRGFEFTLLAALATWSLLILRFGYRFGSGDQVELLPYTLFLHNSGLYPYDFFIQNLNNSVPNERTIMASLLLPFVNHLEVASLALQFLSTISLVIGLEKIAAMFIKNRYFSWLAVVVTLVPLNDFNLGNVELYSECMQAGGLACGIVVWAVYLFLKREFLLSGIILSAATFIQLLDGLDVMILLSAVLMLQAILKKQDWKDLLKFVIPFACTALIYLVVILKNKTMKSGNSITDADLFQILIEFRHPHHFIFSSFPLKKTIVFISLCFIALGYFKSKSQSVFLIVILGLTGLGLYAVMVDAFHFMPIVNFQFYKVSSWLKFFGVTASLCFLIELFSVVESFKFSDRIALIAIAVLTSVSWFIVFRASSILPYKVPYDIFWLKAENDAIQISEKARLLTNKEDVFVAPFDFTELKYFAQRSSFVEFKANVRHRNSVKEWYRRIQLVYGISDQNNVKGFQLKEEAEKAFMNFSNIKLAQLKTEGVTHVLTYANAAACGELVTKNQSYAIYKL